MNQLEIINLDWPEYVFVPIGIIIIIVLVGYMAFYIYKRRTSWSVIIKIYI